MLKIKLARFGKKNQPHYRIVVNEARDKRDGGYVAQVGHYAPAQIPKILQIDVDAYQEWVSKGAQPTPTVASLFQKFQSKDPFPPKKAKPSKKSIAKKLEAQEAAKNETAQPVEEEAGPAPVKEEVAPEAEVKQAQPTEEPATPAPTDPVTTNENATKE